MLLAEELALVAIRPQTGRYRFGSGSELNACLAGLLVAELLLDGGAGLGDRDRVVVVPGQESPIVPVLAAALDVVAEKGPKIRTVLSHMNRGLERRLRLSTWNAVLSGPEARGTVGRTTGALRHASPLLDPPVRDEIVARLRSAAASDGPLDPRTAAVLSMTGPAQLLEVVAPERRGRRHARRRIDHALDGSELAPVARVVRRLLEETAAAATTATVGAAVASSG